MVEDSDLMKLRGQRIPEPGEFARARALKAAQAAFAEENLREVTQEPSAGARLTSRAHRLWREIMQKKMIAAPALAGLVALPIAGYVTMQLVQAPQPGPIALTETVPPVQTEAATAPAEPAPLRESARVDSPDATLTRQNLSPVAKSREERKQEGEAAALGAAQSVEQSAATTMADAKAKEEGDALASSPSAAGRTAETKFSYEMPTNFDSPASAPPAASPGRDKTVMSAPVANEAARIAEPGIMPMPSDIYVQPEPNRDRLAEFKSNPVKSSLQEPVSTFSIDVDTASYAMVRRALKGGALPQADTVRVEEMVNYFPYDWRGPDSREAPFNTTVSVMPTPWNANTKLMHVAIKGFDVIPTEQPKANLVFLIDVSGSMDEPDKLPLLRSAFRMLVGKLRPDDTVSIVTYAGNAGTVLAPTKVAEKEKILQAIDILAPGGSTAGEAGIREAYRLAQSSFVKDGINRVMLATDGDFNVGQTDDDDLKRLIEEKRKSGVFLSVFGFGRGNLNDLMMQTIAQNGNGTAAYIDTLAEAEKVLVEDASSTLFPIAKDVKIQVEFNPQVVSEYRLIGYETRALTREDFNNDKVDAGEIGSGHSVTAIYEVTPKGSPAEQVDNLRYGQATTDNAAGIANASEYAFVKIRYKLPDGDISKLLTQPVTASNEVSSFDAAGADQRFSVAVAAFGQKLRSENATADFGYARISEIANAARGADPFGYRAEFLSLVRLADALGGAAQPIANQPRQ